MSGETAAPSTPAASPRQPIAWADCIKTHHTQFRKHFEALALHTTQEQSQSCDADTRPPREDGNDVHHRQHHAGGMLSATTQTKTLDSHAEEELKRWQCALKLPGEAERRQAYASAMHDLATQAWALQSAQDTPPVDESNSVTTPVLSAELPPSSTARTRRKRPRGDEREAAVKRKNDRILFCLDCISSYFLGRPTEASRVACTESLPTIVSRAIKPLRQDFFQRNGRTAENDEVAAMIDTVSRGAMHGCRAWERAMSYHAQISASGDIPTHDITLAPLQVLDVGSCYGPFMGQTATHPQLGAVPLCVTAIDLEPYHPDTRTPDEGPHHDSPRVVSAPDVLQGDWLSISFYSDLTEVTRHRAETAMAPLYLDNDAVAVTGSAVEGYRVEGLRVGAYDAVIFCLLLSYLPSPRLRYRACLQAFLALEEGGLLVILSTRTQGPRRRPWTEEWIEALGTIGFDRVQKSVRGKIVGLSFARHAAGRAPVVGPGCEALGIPWGSLEEQLASEEGRRVWMETLLATEAAASGLTITADGIADL